MDLQKLFAAAQIASVKITKITAVKNEYNPNVNAEPWYEIDIPWVGRVKVGWRHRVINIDWTFTNRQLAEGYPFTSDDVTQTDKYVHAYGYHKLADYLATIIHLPRRETLFLDGQPEFGKDTVLLRSGDGETSAEWVLDQLITKGELQFPIEAQDKIKQLKLAERLNETSMVYRDRTNECFHLVMRDSYTWFQMSSVLYRKN